MQGGSDLLSLSAKLQLHVSQLHAMDVPFPAEAPDEALWQAHNHVLVVTSAGKPVWSRWGDPDSAGVSTLGSVIQAVHARCAEGGDAIQSISTAGGELIVFSARGPLLLAAVCRGGGTATTAMSLIRALHAHLLFCLTSKLHARLVARPSLDVRHMLQGSDLPLRTLVRLASRSPALWLDAVPVLSVPLAVRTRVMGILATAGQLGPAGMAAAAAGAFSSSGGVVYAILLAGFSVVAWAQPKGREHGLRPLDLTLLSTFLACSGALRVADAWTPLCLPGLSDAAYVHAYVSCLGTVNASGSRAGAFPRGGVEWGGGDRPERVKSKLDRPRSESLDLSPMRPLDASEQFVMGPGAAMDRRYLRAGWLGSDLGAAGDAAPERPPFPSASSPSAPLPSSGGASAYRGAGIPTRRPRLTFASPLAVPLTPTPGAVPGWTGGGGQFSGDEVSGAEEDGASGASVPVVSVPEEWRDAREMPSPVQGKETGPTPPPQSPAPAQAASLPHLPDAGETPVVPPSPWAPPLPYHPDHDRDAGRGAAGSGTPLWLALISTGGDGSPAYVDSLAATRLRLASALESTGLLSHVAAVQAGGGPFATGDQPAAAWGVTGLVHFVYLWKPTRQYSCSTWPAGLRAGTSGGVGKAAHSRRKALLRAYSRVWEEVTAPAPHVRHAVHAFSDPELAELVGGVGGGGSTVLGAIAALHATHVVILAAFEHGTPAARVPRGMEKLAKVLRASGHDAMFGAPVGVL